MFDPELFGQAMAEEIRKAVAPLREEIADLRKQLEEARSQGPDVRQMVAAAVADIPVPKDGKDADEAAIVERVTQAINADLEQWKAEAQGAIKVPELPDIKGMVDSAVADAVKAVPAPKDGKSFTLEDAQPIIDKAVELICEDAEKSISEAVKAIPAPKDGVNGTSVTLDDVRPLIESEIEKAVKQIPVPKDGIGMAGAMIDRDGSLIITMSNGEAKNLGPVVGKDGLSLESFEMTYDADAHEVVLRAVSVGKSQEIRYPAGGIHGKGYWRDGNKAKSGDAWTHDGSLWVAKKDTDETPSTKSGDWMLAARRGRDGGSVVRRVKEGPAAPIKLGGGDAGND